MFVSFKQPPVGFTAHSVHSCLAANFTQPTFHPHISWYQRERERGKGVERQTGRERKLPSDSEVWLILVMSVSDLYYIIVKLDIWRLLGLFLNSRNILGSVQVKLNCRI